MRKIWAAALTLLAALASFAQAPVAPAPAPHVDKQALENYVRYAEGYSAAVQFAVDDPVPSAYPGFFRVLVHLSMTSKGGTSKLDRSYYVTADGQHFISGSIWALNESPFKETLAQLPTGGFSFGPVDAKVTLVVFSDFECPFCQGFAKTLRENLAAKYPKDVRVVFKDFPIDSIHPWAHAAAEASHCFGRQKPDAFWTFHDWMFAHQKEITRDTLREKIMAQGKEQGLDEQKLGACLDTHAAAAEVDASLKAGEALQIRQTPTVFINGRVEPEAVPWAALDAIVQLELERPASIPGPAAGSCCAVSIPSGSKR
jgi:protein-disulfide isomerase